jgi:nitrogen fixation protein NifZ
MGTINPRFERGHRVRATENLFNDGTYSEQLPHALLVRRGEAGDIVRVARNGDSGAVVYMVEFALNQVIGCHEHELTPWCLGAMRSEWFDRETAASSAFISERDRGERIAGSAWPGLRGCAVALAIV